MNTDHILPIGTRVKSLDFPGDESCYVEGIIEGYGGDVFPSDAHYRIRVTKRVWSGEELYGDRVETVVYPPFMGMFGQVLVTKLEG